MSTTMVLAGYTFAVTSGAALSAYTRVKYNSAMKVVVAGVGEAHDGIVVAATTAADQAVEMIPAGVAGIHKAVLSGTCAVGDALYGAANGAVSTARAGPVVGYANEVGADTALVTFRTPNPASQVAFPPTSVKTGAYTANFGEVVLCNPTAAGFTVTLPAAVAGRPPIIVKNDSTSTNTITIDGAGAETIDGAATATIAASRGATRLVPGAGVWYVV